MSQRTRADVAFRHQRNQTEAILELKLRHLAKLEEMKIRGETGRAGKGDQLQGILSRLNAK
ncbi:hypothetical protein KCP75_16730 [Salmonella enterica subsp. enterica]|nr:hypothetical protein KCP75_16730 [Salmonella enterica subsp. enterica]